MSEGPSQPRCRCQAHKSHHLSAAAAATTTSFQLGRPRVEHRLEDGTLPFLDIAALKDGFAMLATLGGMRPIREHTFALAQYTCRGLRALEHYDGSKAAVLRAGTAYSSSASQGPVVNFSLRRADGSWVGHAEVEKMASTAQIHLRTGCFCNSGACHRHLGIGLQQLKDQLAAGHACGDDMDLVDGAPTGTVRVSFGYMSTVRDADALLRFVARDFVESEAPDPALQRLAGIPTSVKSGYHGPAPSGVGGTARLSEIAVFPIKSCGSFRVQSWGIGPTGLAYDRCWLIIDAHGSCLTQKQVPRMTLIHPTIRLGAGELVLSAEGRSPIAVPLDVQADAPNGAQAPRVCPAKVCADKVEGIDCGDEVANWLAQVLSRPCRLVRQRVDTPRRCKLDAGAAKPGGGGDGGGGAGRSTGSASSLSSALSFANESQFLLTSHTSMAELNSKQPPGVPATPIDRFRGNLVVEGGRAFQEDSWGVIMIGRQAFQVLGPCQRCQMVCVDQATSERTAEPLVTLAKTRRFQGRTFFGQYLVHLPHQSAEPYVVSARDNATCAVFKDV